MSTPQTPYMKKPQFHIDPKGMFATVCFPSPDVDEATPEYDMDALEKLLTSEGIVYGIDGNMLASLSKDIPYDTDLIVAVGKEPVEGTNGYYEYHFSQDFSKKPTIRPDGSADFLSIKVIEVVHEGDLIATYHPAVHGTPGMNVRGKEVEPRMMRDMPPMGGRGFHRSEDNIYYYADMDGKIVLHGNRITISPVYEIDQDADMSVGNIDFKGDVVIHGGVKNGIRIHASGSITVDGLVELCDLRAGKDIFLLSGVKGGERTTIHADGNITAEFIEYAIVSCKGNLHADVLFNCLVNCDSKVITTAGKRSAIIGGYVTAVQGVSSLIIGNKFGTVTHVMVGIDEERIKEMADLSDKIRQLESNISKIKQGIEDFDILAEKKGVSYKEDPRRMQLLRVKIRDEAIVAEAHVRYEELKALMEIGRKATVRVYDTVYAGVTVRLMDQYAQMTDFQKRIEFVKTMTGIHMEPLLDPIPEE